MTEKMPEISESFLVNSAVALFLFTIFYNVLFITVIKPAIDGPDRVVPAATTVVEASKDQISNLKASSVVILEILPLEFSTRGFYSTMQF